MSALANSSSDNRDHGSDYASSPVGAAAQNTLVAADTAARLLTADELAARWQVPKSQVYRLVRDGRLPAVHIGRYYRFRLDAVEAWELNGSPTDG